MMISLNARIKQTVKIVNDSSKILNLNDPKLLYMGL